MKKTPALFYGLAFFLGVEAAIHSPIWVLVPLGALLAFNMRSAWLALLVTVMGFCYASTHYSYSAIDEEGIQGVANVDIEGVSFINSRFGNYWYYKGTLRSFSQLETLKNVPITFKLRAKKNLTRPLAGCAYLIPCSLFPEKNQRYRMKVDVKQTWFKGETSFSLAEIRFLAKCKVKEFIRSLFKKKSSQDFLAGLATGEFNDAKIRAAFSRFGLVHLMAISGFHFSLFAAILIFLFRPFFNPYKVTAIVTLLLTAYFFFLGSGPSVLRAWMMAMTASGTLFFQKPVNSRNALGIALIITLLYDPTLCNHMGFQFSFLITAAILYGCAPMEQWLLKLFPKKEPIVLQEYTGLEKHLLLLLSFFRPIVSLNIITTIAALPLSLYYFEKFPLLGFFYNLYFPFLVSISLFLLVLSLVFYFIPLISNVLNTTNDYFTDFILNMTLDVPKGLDVDIRMSEVSEISIIIYYTMFFAAFIIIYYKYNNKIELSSQKLIF